MKTNGWTVLCLLLLAALLSAWLSPVFSPHRILAASSLLVGRGESVESYTAPSDPLLGLAVQEAITLPLLDDEIGVYLPLLSR